MKVDRWLVAGLAIAMSLCLMVLLTLDANAAPGATKLSLAVPPDAAVGQVADVRARLTDASGAPIAKATVRFTVATTFLQASGDMVVDEATTDRDGVALGEFEVRSAGDLSVGATFAGDERHAAAEAVATIAAAGGDQIYEQQAGLRLPGFNSAPALAPTATSTGVRLGPVPGLSELWPALSGWPIALVLMIVWSLYGFAVSLVFRITQSAVEEQQR